MMLRNIGTTEYDLDLAPEGLKARVRRDLKLLGRSIDRIEPQEVLLCSRISFAEAFGLSIVEQLSLEASLRDLSLNLEGSGPLVHERWAGWSWIHTLNEVVSV